MLLWAKSNESRNFQTQKEVQSFFVPFDYENNLIRHDNLNRYFQCLIISENPKETLILYFIDVIFIG